MFSPSDQNCPRQIKIFKMSTPNSSECSKPSELDLTKDLQKFKSILQSSPNPNFNLSTIAQFNFQLNPNQIYNQTIVSWIISKSRKSFNIKRIPSNSRSLSQNATKEAAEAAATTASHKRCAEHNARITAHGSAFGPGEGSLDNF